MRGSEHSISHSWLISMAHILTRVYLGTTNLDAYFDEHNLDFEDLLKHAKTIREKYTTAYAYELALQGGQPAEDFFSVGKSSDGDSPGKKMPGAWSKGGDIVLANIILRIRDALLHYEFQWAIADGDIGRAMNVMAVSTP